MEEVEIKFEREDLTGVIPVETYLFDAARRMGVDIECERLGESDSCAVRVTGGSDLLSETTKAEKEQLTDERRANGERLACQAKIERAGEITIMTTKKEEPEKPDYEVKKEAYARILKNCRLRKKSLPSLNSKPLHSAKRFPLFSTRLR
jgi:ferredoxin